MKQKNNSYHFIYLKFQRMRLEKEKLEQENEKKSKSDCEIFWSSIDSDNKVTQIEKDEINGIFFFFFFFFYLNKK